MFRCCLAALLSVVTTLATAQEQRDIASLWKPYSVQQVGGVIGEEFFSYALQFSGGVQYRNAKAGIGVGVNGYMMRSMPLYLDLRYDIGKKRTKLFVFGNGGLNLLPEYAQRNDFYYNRTITKKLTGTFAEAGIGFKTRIGAELNYNTSFSYVYKKSRFEQKGPGYWDGWQWVDDVSEEVSVENGMIALKVGFDF